MSARRLVLLGLGVAMVMLAPEARAQLACGDPPFVVTDEGDTNETASLRWAIGCANNYDQNGGDPGLGTDPMAIEFNIAAPSGITIGSRLELDRVNVTIDGSTQTGAVAGDIHAGTEPAPAVVITGTVDEGCLWLDGDGSALIGVRINCDTDGASGALLVNGDNVTVKSSVIGDASAAFGIRVSGDNATIGGATAGDGNVVRLVTVDGIHATDGDGLTVLGNVIRDIGEDGVYLGNGTSFTNATVGGASGARNIITGNGHGTGSHSGVAIGTNSTGVDVLNNRIGVDAAGAADGNAYGIRVVSDAGTATDVVIDGNLISASTQSGVQIGSGGTVTLTDNLIGTNADGETVAGFCNGIPQIDDSGTTTASGNTEGDCIPTPTPTQAGFQAACCEFTGENANNYTCADQTNWEGWAGQDQLDEADCDVVAGSIGDTTVAYRLGSNCNPEGDLNGVCAAPGGGGTPTATATPAPPTPTPVGLVCLASCVSGACGTPTPALVSFRGFARQQLTLAPSGTGASVQWACKQCPACDPVWFPTSAATAAATEQTTFACPEVFCRVPDCSSGTCAGAVYHSGGNP